jgi:carboxypeptidase Q
MTESNLLRLADAAPNQSRSRGGPGTRGGQRGGRGGRIGDSNRLLSFLARENAGLVVHESPLGDGGTVFVAAASVPGAGARAGDGATNTPRAWATNAPAMPAQITVAAEDYNRLVRMIQQGEKLKMEVNLQVRFYAGDPMAYNTIAEIPGGDLKNEIVMLGGHLDSWQSGTGATDNGAGVACTMEAMRILSAVKAHPRRTIRIGLWTGEEQGILGSRAYVTKHFGYYTNAATPETRAATDTSPGTVESVADPADPPAKRTLVRQYEYDKLSVYFNLDNGAGKIRGVFMQNNEAVRPIFRRWLEPFRDLGAETLTISNTGSTDHVPFDAVGLPGFQFIQDPLDYSSRSHHSNEDVFDRIVPDDLKQAAVILAAFAYDAAMADSQLPRKPAE